MNIPEWMQVAERELARGVREFPGPADNPRIVAYHAATSFMATDDEVPWCLTEDTEILTEEGWCAFRDLPAGRRVAQVWADGRTDLAVPLRTVAREYTGPLLTIRNRTLDLTCDLEHRWWGFWNTTVPRVADKRPLRALTSMLSVPAIRTAAPDAEVADADIRMAAAFMADGCEHRGRLSFQVSRSRKLDRLRAYRPVYTYTAPRAYGPLATQPLTTFEYARPDAFAEMFSDYKVLRWSFLWSLSVRQLRLFLEEYAFFDGHQVTPTNAVVRTSSPTTRDALLAMVTLAGWLPRTNNCGTPGLAVKDSHEVRWGTTKRTTTILPKDIYESQGTTVLRCVEVPSGLIIVRGRNGNPIVTGNCSSFVNWCLQHAGYEGTRSAAARSWLTWGEPLDQPMYGAVVVLARGKNPAQGHVGFFTDRRPDGKVLLLSGNQGDAVSIAAFDAARVLAYRWPRGA